ncbi:MAG: hydrogenase maturation protease [Synergistaceae bacterium]|jgi:hydrogenase 3 maturation protease|nr:hydrogenase maturation protease [Synergistaceae bacterium]
MAVGVWGVGNVFLGDDAAGCAVAELLRLAGMPGVVDCGTTPENWTATLRRDPPSVLLVVDAADMGLEPGECRLLNLDGMDAFADSSHGIPLPLLLGPFMGLMEIVGIGIQPASLRLGEPFSDAVDEAVRRVADAILKDEWREIARLNA